MLLIRRHISRQLPLSPPFSPLFHAAAADAAYAMLILRHFAPCHAITPLMPLFRCHGCRRRHTPLTPAPSADC
jgi:hypothetical protein